jgi:hypothetical protein
MIKLRMIFYYITDLFAECRHGNDIVTIEFGDSIGCHISVCHPIAAMDCDIKNLSGAFHGNGSTTLAFDQTD